MLPRKSFGAINDHFPFICIIPEGKANVLLATDLLHRYGGRKIKKLPVTALISGEKTVKLCRKKANFRESVDIYYRMCYDAGVSIGKGLSKARYSTAG